MSAASEVIHLLSQAVNVKLSFVAGVVLLMYDTVVNFTDEVNLIWLQPWSVGKVMYLLTRYCGFFEAFWILWYSFDTNLTPDSCRKVYQIAVWSMTFGIIVCQVVLIIRTYAIWERRITILLYLCSIQAVAIIIISFELNQSNQSVIFVPSPSPTTVPCVPTLSNNKLFVVYCCVMGLELNILCLSLVKGLSQWRRDSMPLVRTLYRDGVVYFAVLFTISMTNVIFITTTFYSPYYYLLAEPQRVFHSVLAARLIINLRKSVATMSSEDGSSIFAKGFGEIFTESIDFVNGVNSGGQCNEEGWGE